VNTGNHLLALQMLVDGNTTELDSPKQLCANYKPFQSKNNQQESQTLKKNRELLSLTGTKTLETNTENVIKLPAKKRPYVEVQEAGSEELNVNNESKTLKRSRTDSETLSKSDDCHPLNLLQKMQLSLDSYLMRR